MIPRVAGRPAAALPDDAGVLAEYKLAYSMYEQGRLDEARRALDAFARRGHAEDRPVDDLPVAVRLPVAAGFVEIGFERARHLGRQFPGHGLVLLSFCPGETEVFVEPVVGSQDAFSLA